MSGSLVFDSWALLAWLRGESAAPIVRRYLEEAEAAAFRIYMSWINAGEVYYMLARKNSSADAEKFLVQLPALPIRMVMPNDADVLSSARLKAANRISYAHAFAVTLARQQRAKLLTGDPELRRLDGTVAVEWIGADSLY